jgi:hypothetical protein
VNGARPGLMMPGKPKVGDRYYQEVAPGVALDRAEVLSLTEKVKVPAGTFKNCLKTRESSALEKGTEEKLYAPGVGLLKDGGFKLTKIEKPAARLPDPVAKTFQATFPKAEITKLDVEEENGVTVYDIEFRDGATEKETDITADGTMLEYTVVVPAREVPAAAMRTVRAAAQGAKIGRIERIAISYETKDGKTVKLAQPVTRYAVEITKGDQSTEIVVDPDGTVVEPARWGGVQKEWQVRGIPFGSWICALRDTVPAPPVKCVSRRGQEECSWAALVYPGAVIGRTGLHLPAVWSTMIGL